MSNLFMFLGRMPSFLPTHFSSQLTMLLCACPTLFFLFLRQTFSALSLATLSAPLDSVASPFPLEIMHQTSPFVLPQILAIALLHALLMLIFLHLLSASSFRYWRQQSLRDALAKAAFLCSRKPIFLSVLRLRLHHLLPEYWSGSRLYNESMQCRIAQFPAILIQKLRQESQAQAADQLQQVRRSSKPCASCRASICCGV